MSKIVITKELLEKVARNARLDLSDAQKTEFLPQLQEILSAFEKLDRLDVSKEQPAFQPVSQQNVFRKDIVKKSLPTDVALRNAVHKRPPYFLGPKAIE
ncbi:MAG: Asp-tRNA(Asn)/Glu-tRNA(Gln) amidotransferase subunit GatC [Candidatus Diapherotrites archaeon]|nr:Asp-tRNA(Asn)/Glu-tRNA(Gln) amidotransferase subunit GatC [Candidatus Diapherotrites archaeon]